MAKKININDSGIVTDTPAGDRLARWEAYIANYKAKNPVKYAAKRATTYVDEFTGRTLSKVDEFATIPPSFK